MVRENNSNNSNSPNQNNIKSKKEEVVVTVQDTGNGISPEILPKLFTKFGLGVSELDLINQLDRPKPDKLMVEGYGQKIILEAMEQLLLSLYQ